jgi:hypothetical protein
MLGLLLWMAAHTVALTWAASTVVRGWRSAGFVALLSIGVGVEAAGGNLAGFLAAGYLVVWRQRDRSWIGALIGVMTVAKLMPIALLGFILSRRDWRQVRWFFGGVVGAVLVAVVFAGLEAHIAYLGVMRTSTPQPMSLAWLVDATWVAPLTLTLGTLLAAFLPARSSYVVAVVTAVIGAPGLGWASLCQLLGIADAARSPSVASAIDSRDPVLFSARDHPSSQCGACLSGRHAR